MTKCVRETWDCPSGESCDNGTCRKPRGQGDFCTFDDDCRFAPGFECGRSKRCVPVDYDADRRGKDTCTLPEDCFDFQYCDGNKCQRRKEYGNKCDTHGASEECTDGNICWSVEGEKKCSRKCF